MIDIHTVATVCLAVAIASSGVSVFVTLEYIRSEQLRKARMKQIEDTRQCSIVGTGMKMISAKFDALEEGLFKDLEDEHGVDTNLTGTFKYLALVQRLRLDVFSVIEDVRGLPRDEDFDLDGGYDGEFDEDEEEDEDNDDSDDDELDASDADDEIDYQHRLMIRKRVIEILSAQPIKWRGDNYSFKYLDPHDLDAITQAINADFDIRDYSEFRGLLEDMTLEELVKYLQEDR